MTEAADRVFCNGAVHTLADPDETVDAVAVRDGRVCRLGTTYDVEFLVGVDTDVVDLAGRTLLPGFVDAHTHLTTVGRSLVHADLGVADSPADAVDRVPPPSTRPIPPNRCRALLGCSGTGTTSRRGPTTGT